MSGRGICARHRSGDDEHPRHCLRRRGTALRIRASPAHPDLSRSGRGRARSRGDLAVGARRWDARRSRTSARGGRRDRHHQSARDDDRVGARHGQAARQCHRVARPAHRAALRRAERRGLGRACRRDDRARHRSLFLGDQARLAARQCARSSRAGAQRRGVLRHGRQLSPVQADRRQDACDRGEQRRPHHALRHQVVAHGTTGFSTASPSRAKFSRSFATARTISV